MNYRVVRMYFRRPVHFSLGKMNTYGSSGSLLHSDTIQAALYVSALQLYGQETAETFRRNVVVSSAFPFDEKTGYWLPKPLSFSPRDPVHQKELKKIHYLRRTDFERVINGGEPSVSDLLSAAQPEIWRKDTTQRVLLDRLTNRGVPFYLEKLYPENGHHDRGLYVIVQTAAEGFSKLDALFRLLADNGFGLQRSLGNGTFHYEIEDAGFSLALPTQASKWVNLSLFRPAAEDFPHIRFGRSRYQLVKRGGWIAGPEDSRHSSLRKKAVMMLSEGSVLAYEPTAPERNAPKGKMEDLRPDWEGFPHPVWRDGRGFFLPVITS